MIQIEDYLADITKKKQNQNVNTSKQQKFNDLFFKLKERNSFNEAIIKKYFRKITKKTLTSIKTQREQLFSGFLSSHIVNSKAEDQNMKEYDSQIKPYFGNNNQIKDEHDKCVKELEITNHTTSNLYLNDKYQDISSLPYIHIAFNHAEKNKKNREEYISNSKNLPPEPRHSVAKQNWVKHEQHRKVGSSIKYKALKEKRYKTDRDQMIEGCKVNVKELIFMKESINSQKKFLINRQHMRKTRVPTQCTRLQMNNSQKPEIQIPQKPQKKDTNLNRLNLQYSDSSLSQKIMLPTINTNTSKIQKSKLNINMDNYINFNQYKYLRQNNYKDYKYLKNHGINLKDDQLNGKEMIANMFKIHTIDLKNNERLSSNIIP